MNDPNHPPVQYGFTLVELMITIGIISIVTMIATPNINRQLAQYRIATTANVIEDSLRFALSESSIRHQSITYLIDAQSLTISLINPNNRMNVIKKYEYSDSSQVKTHEQSATDNLDTPMLSSISKFVINPEKRLINDNQTKSLNVEFIICDKSRTDIEGKLVQVNAKVRITVTQYGNCL